MRIHNFSPRFPRALSFAASALALLLLGAPPACAQRANVAPPGDSPATAGPLAHLSPRLSHRDLAKAIKLVANWQLARMPAEAQYEWTWAALYTGFLAVPDKIADGKYQQAMMNLSGRLNWQPGPRVMHADDQAIGQTYLQLYRLHQDHKMIEPMMARLNEEMAAPGPTDPQRPLWWWCDALFMAPPVYAEMYTATGDTKYLAFMDRQWDITTKLLYDPAKHLYFRDASYLDKKEKNGQPLFWSRGNGWVMAGIVRVLKELPANSPLRPRFIALLRDMAAEMLSIQGSDGLWRPGLLDPGAYPLPEVSGSAFITYALAYGVNEGILDRATYWPAVEKAWAGLLTHVYADGRLGSIQPVGAAPGAYTETSSYVYGVGAYLLAGSEIYRAIR